MVSLSSPDTSEVGVSSGMQPNVFRGCHLESGLRQEKDSTLAIKKK